MTDLRDERSGAYDPVTAEGRPQPDQVDRPQSAHERAQPGAGVRSRPPFPGNLPLLPAGLRRPPMGPYSNVPAGGTPELRRRGNAPIR